LFVPGLSPLFKTPYGDNPVEIGQTRLAGEQETAPNEGTHSVKNSPELVDEKLCRIAHPTTLSHFAPGILHSPIYKTSKAASTALKKSKVGSHRFTLFSESNFVYLTKSE
jgi:hypothetical protein